MKNRFVLPFLFISLLADAQEYKDVAGIFYARCTSCHHTGAHEYPFMDHTQTFKVAPLIQQALLDNIMPPWSADTSYSRFQHERIITASEKQTILDWIANGAQKGDTTLAPAAPVYTAPYQLHGEADLTLSIGTFTSTSLASDKYFCFSIPSGLTQDRIIRAFEVVPGNKAIVHHAVITADTLGTYNSDLTGYCYNIPGNLGIGTYAPGQKATVFPSQSPLKCGIHLKAGSRVIIQLHYPEGSAGQVDSTKIRLFFYPLGTTDVRRIYSTTPLQNWNMNIPANSVVPYSAYYPSASQGLPAPLSVYGIMPHSHLICKSIICYAVNPGIDTIPLVRINEWDFEWQDFYIFKRLVKIPAGYRLYAKHVFDNTSANPHNPNDPPLTVYAGTDTDDEMLFDGMLMMPYESGDEVIDVEQIIRMDPLLGVKEMSHYKAETNTRIVPNPFSNEVSLEYNLENAEDVTIEVFNLMGVKLKSASFTAQPRGHHKWDLPEVNKLSPGVYIYRIFTPNGSSEGKMIRN